MTRRENTTTTITRYVTVGGALVNVIRYDEVYVWRCEGCRRDSRFPHTFSDVETAGDKAQDHADICRAVPATADAAAPASAGDRLVAEAVRDLARAVAEAGTQRQAARRPWWRRGGER